MTMAKKTALRQKLRKLDFQALEVFYNMYTYQSVTEVSEVLSLSQSTISYSLNRLRTAFDDQLFVSSRVGMKPTYKATLLIESIGEILDKISTCGAENQSFSPHETNTVFTIFSPEYFEILVIPMLLKKINDEDLKISIEVIRPEDKVPFESIADQKIDVGVVLSQGYYPHSLQHQTVLNDKLVAVFDGKEKESGSSVLSLEEFSERKQIFPSPWLNSNCMIDTWLNKQDLQRTIAVKANGYYSGIKMLTGSKMMMMLPEKVYKKLSQQHTTLHARQAPKGLPGFSLDIIWSPSSSDTLANIWLREQIMIACKEINQEQVSTFLK
ncbi:LysR family transcriptional regulator [Photobacterium sp.]|uniref:LysR family transcriptional regulator n=1 Tax=Photobacterium sp. TaxID=660 RepID=UPI00299DC9AF|nr:LysR family transcriptional regulator [Photobacterium sp.]MDX1300819.1 LysR family transcriptional regulator [Photobacterium sp.]